MTTEVRVARPWESVFSEEERAIYDLYRRPSRPDLPWDGMALLVVDITLAFLGPRLPTIEAAAQVRTACGLPAWESLGPTRMLIDAFRSAGRPVIYTRAFSESHLGGATIGAAEPGHGNEFPDEIAPADGDVVIEKARANAFFGTPLTAYLIRERIRGLVVVGGTTSGCVRASVLDASALGFAVAIAHDGCFDRSSLSHAVALHELDVKYATVLDADEAARRIATLAAPRS
jgi:nicotinamidase-related amidase